MSCFADDVKSDLCLPSVGGDNPSLGTANKKVSGILSQIMLGPWKRVASGLDQKVPSTVVLRSSTLYGGEVWSGLPGNPDHRGRKSVV
jgi:hypothetical protein